MEYSDGENQAWWNGLTKGDRLQLIDEVVQKAFSRRLVEAAYTVKAAIQWNRSPDPKDLNELRKWARA